MIKVTLSPVYDSYVPRNDLERELSLRNLSYLMPEIATKAAFDRTMRNTEENYGVKFTVVKESSKDIMWTVTNGRQTLGTYMLVYGLIGKKNKPTYTGSKHRVLDKTRTPADRQFFKDICDVLTDALHNPGVNSYTFHLRVLKWCRENADAIEPRQTGVKNGPVSSIYHMREKYRADLENLQAVYILFNMTIKLEA